MTLCLWLKPRQRVSTDSMDQIPQQHLCKPGLLLINTFILEVLQEQSDPANLGILEGYVFFPFICLFFFQCWERRGEEGGEEGRNCMSNARSIVHVYHRMALQHKPSCSKNAAAQHKHCWGEVSNSSNFVTRLSPISHKTALAGRWIHFWLEQYIRYYDKFAVYLI